MDCYGRRIFCSDPCRLTARRAELEDVVSRFWSKVEKRGEDECWGWNAQKRWDGYGRFVTKYRPQWAHRFSWELHNGRKIVKGEHVLHSCDNPACTNPKHLRLGTHAENMAEMKAKGRNPKGEALKINKITEAQARDILARKPAKLRQRGYTKAIATEYGLHVGAINAIWRGDAWSHIQ